jgi:hypothetical protein
MRALVWTAVVAALLASGWELRAENPRDGLAQDSLLKRLAPAGGWHPYGGGLLHWWPAHCFPCNGGPDDYCRKPLPSVCWPPYPSYYTWGLPEIGIAQQICQPAGKQGGQPTPPMSSISTGLDGLH